MVCCVCSRLNKERNTRYVKRLSSRVYASSRCEEGSNVLYSGGAPYKRSRAVSRQQLIRSTTAAVTTPEMPSSYYFTVKRFFRRRVCGCKNFGLWSWRSYIEYFDSRVNRSCAGAFLICTTGHKEYNGRISPIKVECPLT